MLLLLADSDQSCDFVHICFYYIKTVQMALVIAVLYPQNTFDKTRNRFWSPLSDNR